MYLFLQKDSVILREAFSYWIFMLTVVMIYKATVSYLLGEREGN